MGLLTILKKMKQKERELRLLMLYPPGRPGREGRGPSGREVPGAPCRARCVAAGRYPLPPVRHARGSYQSLRGRGGRTNGPGRGGLASPGQGRASGRRAGPVSLT